MGYCMYIIHIAAYHFPSYCEAALTKSPMRLKFIPVTGSGDVVTVKRQSFIGDH